MLGHGTTSSRRGVTTSSSVTCSVCSHHLLQWHPPPNRRHLTAPILVWGPAGTQHSPSGSLSHHAEQQHGHDARTHGGPTPLPPHHPHHHSPLPSLQRRRFGGSINGELAVLRNSPTVSSSPTPSCHSGTLPGVPSSGHTPGWAWQEWGCGPSPYCFAHGMPPAQWDHVRTGAQGVQCPISPLPAPHLEPARPTALHPLSPNLSKPQGHTEEWLFMGWFHLTWASCGTADWSQLLASRTPPAAPGKLSAVSRAQRSGSVPPLCPSHPRQDAPDPHVLVPLIPARNV